MAKWQGGLTVDFNAFLDINGNLTRKVYEKYFDTKEVSFEELKGLYEKNWTFVRPYMLNDEIKKKIVKDIYDAPATRWESSLENNITAMDGAVSVGDFDVGYNLHLIHDEEHYILNPFLCAEKYKLRNRDFDIIIRGVFNDLVKGDLFAGKESVWKDDCVPPLESSLADSVLYDESLFEEENYTTEKLVQFYKDEYDVLPKDESLDDFIRQYDKDFPDEKRGAASKRAVLNNDECER